VAILKTYIFDKDEGSVDTKRGVNQYQVQLKNFFNLYFNQIIYSIISNEQ
jgi:hypothetical protein